MQKFVLKMFDFLKNFWHLCKILSVFLIILVLLFWIQNISNSHWEWLSLFIPFLKGLTNFSSSISSHSFEIFGALFEVKYMISIIILTALCYFFDLLLIISELAEKGYITADSYCRKVEEKNLNRQLINDVKINELKITKYSVTIHTAVKSKFNTRNSNIDIDQQNEIMNEYIKSKLRVTPTNFEGGFIYYFDQFENVDLILDVLFKIINSKTPLKYAICIQVDHKIEQLKHLTKLRHYNQIIMAADTSFRYEFNKFRHYETAQIGIFQIEQNNTLEVHEFKNYL